MTKLLHKYTGFILNNSNLFNLSNIWYIWLYYNIKFIPGRNISYIWCIIMEYCEQIDRSRSYCPIFNKADPANSSKTFKLPSPSFTIIYRSYYPVLLSFESSICLSPPWLLSMLTTFSRIHLTDLTLSQLSTYMINISSIPKNRYPRIRYSNRRDDAYLITGLLNRSNSAIVAMIWSSVVDHWYWFDMELILLFWYKIHDQRVSSFLARIFINFFWTSNLSSYTISTLSDHAYHSLFHVVFDSRCSYISHSWKS